MNGAVSAVSAANTTDANVRRDRGRQSAHFMNVVVAMVDRLLIHYHPVREFFPQLKRLSTPKFMTTSLPASHRDLSSGLAL
jgi:hypothetical protein